MCFELTLRSRGKLGKNCRRFSRNQPEIPYFDGCVMADGHADLTNNLGVNSGFVEPFTKRLRIYVDANGYSGWQTWILLKADVEFLPAFFPRQKRLPALMTRFFTPETHFLTLVNPIFDTEFI